MAFPGTKGRQRLKEIREERARAVSPEKAEGYVILDALTAQKLAESVEPYRQAGWRMLHYTAVAGPQSLGLPTAYSCVMERDNDHAKQGGEG